MKNNNLYNEAAEVISAIDAKEDGAQQKLSAGAEMYAREVVRLNETFDSALEFLRERGVSEADLRFVRRAVKRDEQSGYCYVFFDPTSANTNTYAYSEPFASSQKAWEEAANFASRRWPNDEKVSEAVNAARTLDNGEQYDIFTYTDGNQGPLAVQVVKQI